MTGWIVASALYLTGALVTALLVEEVNRDDTTKKAIVVLVIVFWPVWAIAGALAGVVQWVWEHRRRH
jgi:hypothetical protein